ncbi:MAG: hypothetical protein ACOC7N_04185 [Chloroflexota bacterium]
MGRRLVLIGALGAALALVACSSGEMATVVVTGEPWEPEPAPARTATPVPTPAPTASPTPVVEERTAEVEWPNSMRVGDGEVVRVSLLALAQAAEAGTPEVAEHEVESAALELPVARAGYQGMVSASLTAAGLEVTAAGPAEQPLVPGGTNTWRWTVSAPRAGTYRPVVNVTVRWEPMEGSGGTGPVEELVWSRVLTVRARGVLGLSGPQVDWMGTAGSVLGTVAGIPFLEKVLTTLWGRVRGPKDQAEQAGGNSGRRRRM